MMPWRIVVGATHDSSLAGRSNILSSAVDLEPYR